MSLNMLRLQAMKAATVVERYFPPKNANEAYAIVAALNRLNALVKLPQGSHVVSYGYIKGMVACMFLLLTEYPIEEIALYWDEKEDVTYFLLSKVFYEHMPLQFSFHHVPILPGQAHRFRRHIEQQWDGIELQAVSAKLLKMVCRKLPPYEGPACSDLEEKMLHFRAKDARQRLRPLMSLAKPKTIPKPKIIPRRRPRIPQSQQALRLKGMCACDTVRMKKRALDIALHFHIWTTPKCVLYRYGDNTTMTLIRYDGTNYNKVRKTVMCHSKVMIMRKEGGLKVNRLYYCERKLLRWVVLPPSNHILMAAHFCNLRSGSTFKNLCVTYGIARYLTYQFPQLRFVNVLNYTRMVCHRRIFTYRQLQLVPLGSKSRTLKVWLLVDEKQILKDFRIDDLPQHLIDEYVNTPDYHQFFTVTRHRGLCGLYAYSRFHLLPCIYRSITIHSHFARVMNTDKKIAIYALMQERFITDFVYDSIWYDSTNYRLMGRSGSQLSVIHDLAPWARNRPKVAT